MAELYVNDYLMNLKRLNWNGQLGFIGGTIKNLRIWRSR